MKVKELVNNMSLNIVAGKNNLDREVSGGFVGDLLSIVMGKAKEGQVWVTIQSHVNIVAVAALTNIACIIVTEGYKVDEDAIEKANEEDVIILSTKKSSFETVKELVESEI